ncbi:MAG: pantoate--beta-alanine ligase [Salibacteraceae bacterium]
MGALHEGHMALVRQSLADGMYTVVSIFVNPTQFNNPDDLIKYPVDKENDLRMLAEVGCHMVYIPDENDVYPPGMDRSAYMHDLGDLAKVYEGYYRPGHFSGVAQVVHRLFEIVRPHRAYFGEKDIQQVAVVRKMVELARLNVEIMTVPTQRSNLGLALSSRNRRLTEKMQSEALIIYRSLLFARDNFKKMPVAQIADAVESMFEKSPLELEYFDIVDGDTFTPVEGYAGNENRHIRAIIAAYAGDVRLIDNMRLN